MTETVGTTAGVTPTIGRIVHYRLNDADVDLIAQRRAHLKAAGGGVIGNSVAAGEVYPANVVRTFGGGGDPYVNLQVQLDGYDTYWATSRAEGDGPGTWGWPPRV
jgi:hypothetical protein